MALLGRKKRTRRKKGERKKKITLPGFIEPEESRQAEGRWKRERRGV